VCVCARACVRARVCVREREIHFVMKLYFGEVEHCALCRLFVSFGQWHFHAESRQ
jgi:hypothetical protein